VAQFEGVYEYAHPIHAHTFLPDTLINLVKERLFRLERIDDHPKSQLRRLTRLIYTFYSYNCTDRRDMVYALLGLADSEIKADYTKSTAKIYCEVLEAEQPRFSVSGSDDLHIDVGGHDRELNAFKLDLRLALKLKPSGVVRN
jgi:hypothetical protein